jgi:hypothetical protein
MDKLRNLDWRNINSQRNYPFMDSATLTFSGGFIPQDWILDARVYARNLYQQASTPYVGTLVRTSTSVALRINSGSGELLGETVVPFTDPGTSQKSLFSVMDGDVVAGCVVIDPDKTYLLQSLDEGEYLLEPSVASFVPSVSEYLPGSQVQSLNGRSGAVTITGMEGIRVDKIDDSTIKISVVGDPHFNRYNCVEGVNDDANDALDLNGTFLSNLSIVHYYKIPSGQLVGPVVSRLKRKPDGSVVLSLKTTAFDPSQDTRDLRPAFRISVSGSTITFSMAGA